MSKQPTVSVIIPVYNGERFLGEALQSVLNQSLPPTDLIVVDDGSTDKTAQVVASLAATASVPIHYVYQANQGQAAARNKGIKLAQSEILAFQDADDIWAKEKQRRQMALFQSHAHAQVVIGYSILSYSPESRNEAARLPGQSGLILLLQASLIRRELFDRVGGFNPLLRKGEDIDWFLQVLEQPIEIIVHPELVVTYRRHDANLTGELHKNRQQLVTALRYALIRRRQNKLDANDSAKLTFLSDTRK